MLHRTNNTTRTNKMNPHRSALPSLSSGLSSLPGLFIGSAFVVAVGLFVVRIVQAIATVSA